MDSLNDLLKDVHPINHAVDDIMRQIASSEQEVLNRFIQNPGVVATYGDDFVFFVETEIRDDMDLYRETNEYSIKLVHHIHVRPRRPTEGLSEDALRMNLDGNLESV